MSEDTLSKEASTGLKGHHIAMSRSPSLPLVSAWLEHEQAGAMSRDTWPNVGLAMEETRSSRLHLQRKQMVWYSEPHIVPQHEAGDDTVVR